MRTLLDTIEDVSWDLYEEVKSKIDKNHILLDIGTGGGERVLEIAHHALLLIGIDKSLEMINAANINLLKTNFSNVKFLQMSAEKLEFPDRFFDVISCRHCCFDSTEIFRVLGKNGVFLTQNVSESDKLNIKEAFGRGQCFGQKDGKQKEIYLEELKKAGFSEVKSFDYDAKEYYQTPEDLIFLLKHTPIIPDFGYDSMDFNILKTFIEQNKTEKGIYTNSKRYMIIAKK